MNILSRVEESEVLFEFQIRTKIPQERVMPAKGGT